MADVCQKGINKPTFADEIRTLQNNINIPLNIDINEFALQ